MRPIALCLQTCNRADFTARTLETFAAHNDLTAFQLLHADDASEGPENLQLATRYGFRTVVRTEARAGMRAVRTKLVAAATKVSDWILLLENDIETLRPFPWPLFWFVTAMPQVYTLRLYGRFKDVARQQKCLETNKRLGHAPVEWRPLKGAPEPSQIGAIHWSAQPAVTRARDLLRLHRTGIEPHGLTVRVKANAMAHFGFERTPGRVK